MLNVREEGSVECGLPRDKMFEGIKAVGFDLDGTFLNTHVDYQAVDLADKDACRRHGIPFDELEFTTVKRLRQPIRDWLISHGRENEIPIIEKEIDSELTRIELEHVDEARPFPGSLECVRELKSRGYKVGLLTRGSLEYGDTVLKMMGIRDEFDVVVGRDYTNYDHAKPSPKAMQYFADELGVKASEILYLGDNRTDYYSARDAGAVFVGVLSGSMDREGWLKEDPEMTMVQYAGDVLSLL
jgi:phosphoglycolate phosphatase